jgi:multicomponent Na+:H+ antiporter subunit E
MNLFALNVILALIWAAITNAFTPLNVLVGFVIGSMALWLLRWDFNDDYLSRSFKILGLVLLFLSELLKSAFRVAWDVVRPGLNFQPGIIAYPLTTDDDLQITILANLISLTPGTLSVDVSTDKTTLYIHAMHAHDPEELRRDIRDGFERQIKEALG